MSKTSSQPTKPVDPIVGLRAAIADAEAQGVARKGMTLKLTHRDASIFKRSRDIADDEISFEGGQMSFLGIPVEIGTVTVSALQLT